MRINPINNFSNKCFTSSIDEHIDAKYYPDDVELDKHVGDYWKKALKDESVGYYSGDVELSKISEKYRMKISNIDEKLKEYGVSVEELDDKELDKEFWGAGVEWANFDPEVKRLYEKYLEVCKKSKWDFEMAYRRSDRRKIIDSFEARSRPMLALPPHNN
ncbi:MAG: hypothetical protein LBK53_00170 [Heliobacteriaceae bacterium]|jgi:hypothetical protein|nr:hypothetical protein [Heliobacteriaceae bacterium]